MATALPSTSKFCGLDIDVNGDVLRPYRATEAVVEKAIDMLRGVRKPKICDVGTGSGNIVVAILKRVPRATAVALDISERAVRMARRNAIKHGVAGRIRFIVSDVLEAIDETFDLIVCNPPYLTKERADAIGDALPRIALTDEGDGLSVIRRLAIDAPPRLVPGGKVVVEYAGRPIVAFNL